MSSKAENEIAKNQYRFQNENLDLESRVNDLIAHLTLEEKIAFIPTSQIAVERLGIKKYSVGGEASHGWVSREGDAATVFPQPIGLSSSWDQDLLKKVGSVIGDETRAYHNLKNTGLTRWAPTVGLLRDPRWGRTEEAYGEDPFLTGELASFLVKGMQGAESEYLKMSAALKHFYGNNNEINRGSCNVTIDSNNKRNYYWKPYKKIIEKADVTSMMTAYNEVNGVPCNVNSEVKKIVKDEWKLSGFIVSDGFDFNQTVNLHRFFDEHAKTAAATIKTGVDCIPDDPELIKDSLKKALEKNYLSEKELDQALKNIFKIHFRLGEFDKKENNPYKKYGQEKICTEKAKKLALKAAQKATVLLKNQSDFLPLAKEKKQKIALIGPLADELYQDWYTGEYPYKITALAGIKNKFKNAEIIYEAAKDIIAVKSKANGKYLSVSDNGEITASAAEIGKNEKFELTDWGWDNFTIKSLANDKFLSEDNQVKARAEKVYGWFVKERFKLIDFDAAKIIKNWDDKLLTVENEASMLKLKDKNSSRVKKMEKFEIEILESGLKKAAMAAEKADMVFTFLGNHPLINGKEEIDRPDITLADFQQKLIKKVYQHNPKTAAVLISSYPLAVNWIEENIPAVVYSAHGGQEMGNALADVISGDYNPAGRLSMTWYQSASDTGDIMDYNIIKSKRTYMFFEGKALYPFGYGLSYSDFEYKNLDIISSDKEKITVQFDLKNTSRIKGEEVVQLYIKKMNAKFFPAQKELKAFSRIELAAGEENKIQLDINQDDLERWDPVKEEYYFEADRYKIFVGAASADIRLKEELTIG